jgi:UDP-glucose 4-epimerase
VPHRLAERRPGDPVTTYSDVTYSRKVLGWQARHGLTEIIETAYAWHTSTLNP